MRRNLPMTRRSALMSFGALGLAAAVRPAVAAAQQTAPTGAMTDFDIFNFALNLESLETEYYLRGTTGKGMDAADAGTSPGPVTGGRMVPWKNDDLKEFMEEVAANELAHVRFYRRTLGSQAVPRPAIDLTAFAAAAKAAGLGDNSTRLRAR
jgi:hypothetical protein